MQPVGRSQIWFNDVYKSNVTSVAFNLEEWEELTGHRTQWKQAVHDGMQRAERERERE